MSSLERGDEMIADLLAVSDVRWRRFLDRTPHDVYHLPEYCCVAGHHEGGEPVAFYAEEDGQAVLVPMLLRELPPELGAPPGWRDATSPYGYPGPIATLGTQPDVLRASLRALRALAQEHAIVSAFLRLHPFYTVPVALLAEAGTVVHHGGVVYVDLTKSPDEWRAETRLDHQRNLKRLIQLGYSAEMDDWDAYPASCEVYWATMRRHSADSFYYFSDEYFSRLRRMLGQSVHLCSVRGPAGDVAASGLFLLVGGIAEYHLGGTADAHFAKAPSKLMFDFVRRWAKDRGATLLNLGGGVAGAADSLYRFKSGFSPLSADYHTVRIVFDAPRYHALVEVSRALSAADDTAEAFFPAYRRRSNITIGV
ncbi:MAG TPA: GNAT family N-acetyltransferase [Gemmatimonadaceae bacterium]|nr:GNAT family N-acetyltransferase [Gemmatimonadaceae bacterium]